jgi:hypothetical protein
MFVASESLRPSTLLRQVARQIHLATCRSSSRLTSTYTTNLIIRTSDHKPMKMETDHERINDLGTLKYAATEFTIILYNSRAYDKTPFL